MPISSEPDVAREVPLRPARSPARARVGLVLPNRGERAIDNVRHFPAVAEAMGFDSLWFTDHVIGVRQFAPVYGPHWAECLTSLAYAAANTSRIRLAVGVLVVPYRDPVLAAKMLSTIDGLSDGRLIVGLGAGWSRAEFYAVGRGDAFDRRGSLTDEAIEVMLRCWAGGELSFAGEWFNFRGVAFEPRPVQRPHPPLWVGGHTKPALRRAARFADVWHPSNPSPADLVRLGDELDAQAGRSIARTVRLRVPPSTSVAEFAATLAAYEEAGAVEVVIEIDTDDVGIVEAWAGRLAEARRAAGCG